VLHSLQRLSAQPAVRRRSLPDTVERTVPRYFIALRRSHDTAGRLRSVLFNVIWMVDRGTYNSVTIRAMTLDARLIS
jgi:hypothetical protein